MIRRMDFVESDSEVSDFDIAHVAPPPQRNPAELRQELEFDAGRQVRRILESCLQEFAWHSLEVSFPDAEASLLLPVASRLLLADDDSSVIAAVSFLYSCLRAGERYRSVVSKSSVLASRLLCLYRTRPHLSVESSLIPLLCRCLEEDLPAADFQQAIEAVVQRIEASEGFDEPAREFLYALMFKYPELFYYVSRTCLF